MFPPIPAPYRKTFPALIAALAIFAGLTAYLLQIGAVEFAAGAAGFLGVLVALAQWMVGQLREAARSTWEAVQKFYVEGDDPRWVEVRLAIRRGDLTNAPHLCNLYEKWGHLAKLSYLPLEVFDGPCGTSTAFAAVKLKNFLTQQRASHRRYAESYLWLVSRIQQKGYLKAQPGLDAEVRDLLRELNAA